MRPNLMLQHALSTTLYTGVSVAVLPLIHCTHQHQHPHPHQHQCEQMGHINCDTSYIPEGDEAVCGSDQRGYPSLCHFAQQKCHDRHLTILHNGQCSLTTPPTQNTAQTFLTTIHPHSNHTVDPLYTVFCSYRENINCTGNTSVVICGTDTNLYTNSCEFSKAKCDDADLKEQDASMCLITTSIPPVLG